LARLSPARWDALFLVLLSLILVVGIDTLGAAMVVVMLFLPAATTLPLSRGIPLALMLAALAGCAFLLIGFVVSIEMGWPLSQTVGGVGCTAFVVSHTMTGLRRRIV
jgi:ABC-type Mn2+/Zn2+ transport system permease subunit